MIPFIIATECQLRRPEIGRFQLRIRRNRGRLSVNAGIRIVITIIHQPDTSRLLVFADLAAHREPQRQLVRSRPVKAKRAAIDSHVIVGPDIACIFVGVMQRVIERAHTAVAGHALAEGIETPPFKKEHGLRVARAPLGLHRHYAANSIRTKQRTMRSANGFHVLQVQI